MITPGTKCEIYWNLHHKVFSVRVDGLVVKHMSNIILEDATFSVQPAGNRKVRETRKKNVHAFIRGIYKGSSDSVPSNITEVYYNPYKVTDFVQFIKPTNIVRKAKWAFCVTHWDTPDTPHVYVPDFTTFIKRIII